MKVKPFLAHESQWLLSFLIFGMKPMFKYLFIFTAALLSSVYSAKAQHYGDPDFYLIDSLDIDAISKTDSVMLDSCLSVYHKEKDDTLKIEAIKFIIEESWDKNIWPRYNEWLYNTIQKRLEQKHSKEITLYYKQAYASAINNQGYLYSSEGNAHQALIYYKESLEIQKSINDKEGVATSLNNIGAIYNKVGDIQNAIDYYLQSAEIYTELGDKLGQAQSLNNLGHIHHSQKNKELALEYFQKSLSLFEEIDYQKGVATLLNSIGYFYYKEQDFDEALDYYKKSLIIRKEINDLNGTATTLNNIASAYSGKNELDSAQHYYLQCIPLYQDQNNKEGLAITFSNLARNYFNTGEKDKALSYSEKSLNLAKETQSPKVIAAAAMAYSQILEQTGNPHIALDMLHLYVEMRDSTYNQKNKIASAKSEAKYEFEIQKVIQEKEHEQELQLSELKHEKEIAIQQKAKENQTILSFAIGLVLLLTAALLIVVFLRLKITRKQKTIIETQKTIVEKAHHELEEKNKEIIDSINYAKRIQMAILPPQKLIKEVLPKSFVFYKPKDVVAGDFYWLEQSDDKTLIAACDCTGHGVPGAMVSVICNNGLNRSVREYGYTLPGEILDMTREIVVQEFEKSENEVSDGMDVALVSLIRKEDCAKIQYAGANNPLWIIRNVAINGKFEHDAIRASTTKNDNFELYEIGPDHQPIGKFENAKPYHTHELDLLPGDIVYIFSDGYADQFGGEKGKKFKTVNFKKLLLSIQNTTIQMQGEVLENAFEDWRKDFEQVDDICVIGLQV